MPNFSLSLNVRKILAFELYITLKSFLSAKGAASLENQKNTFKSLLTSYCFVKRNRIETEQYMPYDRAKVNL